MGRRKKKKDSKRNEVIGIIIIGFAAFTAITVYLNIDSCLAILSRYNFWYLWGAGVYSACAAGS
jgi:hypothetical protein